MNTNINLKELWERQVTTLPDEKEIFAKAEKLKANIRNKSIGMIFILLATIVIIIFVWAIANLQMVTSRVGITMVIIAISLEVVNFIKTSLLLLKDKIITTNTKTYLKHMLQLKRQQEFAQTKLLATYFVLLSVGITLYLYEPTTYMEITGKIFTYVLTFGWIVFVWFYLRPKTIKKQKTKINSIIEKLNSINKDLTTEE